MRATETGSVTVEAALVLPALVTVLALGLGALVAAVAQGRCQDAAAAAARLHARGDPDTATLVVDQLAPPGAVVSVNRRGELITVRVAVNPVGSLLPGLRVEGAATAFDETSVSSG